MGEHIESVLDAAALKIMDKDGIGVQPSGDYVDLHELAKGWKAAIARASDPATK